MIKGKKCVLVDSLSIYACFQDAEGHKGSFMQLLITDIRIPDFLSLFFLAGPRLFVEKRFMENMT